MSILVRFAPTSAVTTQQYDETISRLESDGGDFRRTAWSTTARSWRTGTSASARSGIRKSSGRRSGQRLMPLLADVGIDPGTPEIMEVHNTIGR